MRISELSRRSGVPVPTLRFYIRERLLPPGRSTARNQAQYGEEHVSRAVMVRMLTDVGGLSIVSVREVLTAVDSRRLSLGGLCHRINEALSANASPVGRAPDAPDNRRRVDAYLDGLGWRVGAEHAGRDTVAQVLGGLQRLGLDCDVGIFDPYAEVADRLAAHELDAVPADAALDEVASTFAARAVLFEVALAALRRMAREHRAALRAEAPDAGPDGGPNGDASAA